MQTHPIHRVIQARGGQTIQRIAGMAAGILEVMIVIGTAAGTVGILEATIAAGIVAAAGIPEATAEAGTAMVVIVAAGKKGRSNV